MNTFNMDYFKYQVELLCEHVDEFLLERERLLRAVKAQSIIISHCQELLHHALFFDHEDEEKSQAILSVDLKILSKGDIILKEESIDKISPNGSLVQLFDI